MCSCVFSDGCFSCLLQVEQVNSDDNDSVDDPLALALYSLRFLSDWVYPKGNMEYRTVTGTDRQGISCNMSIYTT